METEIGVMYIQAKERQGLLTIVSSTEEGIDSLLRAQEGTNSADTFDFRLLASRTVRV